MSAQPPLEPGQIRIRPARPPSAQHQSSFNAKGCLGFILVSILTFGWFIYRSADNYSPPTHYCFGRIVSRTGAGHPKHSSAKACASNEIRCVHSARDRKKG